MLLHVNKSILIQVAAVHSFSLASSAEGKTSLLARDLRQRRRYQGAVTTLLQLGPRQLSGASKDSRESLPNKQTNQEQRHKVYLWTQSSEMYTKAAY